MSGANRQSERIAAARVLSGLALSEGIGGLGVRATSLCCKKHLPRFEAERFGDPLDLACGSGAPAFKDVTEPCELHS